MEIISVNKDNFDSEVINSKIPVLVDFNATWCGPCRMLEPILKEISEETDNYKIASIDVDKNEDIAQEYKISSIPCLIIFKEGKEVSRSIGLKSKEEINSMIGE